MNAGVKPLTYAIAGMILAYALADGMRANFPDSFVFFNAGHGRFIMEFIPQPRGKTAAVTWNYADPWQYVWIWARLLNYRMFCALWFVVQAGSFLYVVKRLIEETGTHAPLILIVFSKPLCWMLAGSNIQNLLVAVSFTPVGAALASGIKPYCALLVGIAFVAAAGAMGSDHDVQRSWARRKRRH